MAHFAQLDQNNIVVTVIVINNDVIQNLPFPESEPIGVEFCQSLYGVDTVWKQTSYNSSFRKKFAGIDMAYDANIDAFIYQQPYPSWTLNPNTGNWDPPIPMPDDGHFYSWDEATQSWVEGPIIGA
jgi:hypothetical protein